MVQPSNPIKINCHEKCKERTLHSVCIMPATLRAKVLDSMIEKVSAIKGESNQLTRRVWEYAQVEVLWKRDV